MRSFPVAACSTSSAISSILRCILLKRVRCLWLRLLGSCRTAAATRFAARAPRLCALRLRVRLDTGSTDFVFALVRLATGDVVVDFLAGAFVVLLCLLTLGTSGLSLIVASFVVRSINLSASNAGTSSAVTGVLSMSSDIERVIGRVGSM